MRTQPSKTKRKARAMARRLAVEVLARTGAGQASAKPQGDVILLLHHMPEPFFARMDEVVAMMLTLAEPASYSEICAGPSDRPRFTVTFDDGNKSQMRAAERLADVGVSACFFIIADALDADDDEAARICRDELWMDPTPFMDGNDLDTLLTMGHEVGSHTLGHRNLAQISGDELAHQIGGSKNRLAPWMGESPHFAWPFGGPGDFTKRAYDLVSEAGYVSCATAIRGMGLLRPNGDGIPVTLRQSLDLRDSLAVHRRFILNSETHTAQSIEALAYLGSPTSPSV